MGRPTLSVVLPNYNHARYLPRALDSLLNQSRPPDELLVLDDASTDNSREIMRDYAARFPSLRVVHSERNQGVNAANNRLFEMAQGDYLLAAAADDEWLPGFFETAMRMAEQHPEAGAVFGQLVFVDENDRELEVVAASRWAAPLFAPPERFLPEFLEHELATHALSPAVIYRRACFDQVGRYRNELGAWADSFAFRAVGLAHGVCYAPERFARSRRIAGSYSHQSKSDPRRALDVIARAARLMRSDEFRDRFPANHVRRWERRYRRLVIWNDWLGDAGAFGLKRPGFLIRNLQRLPRTLRSLRLAWYRPKATNDE